MPSSKLFKRGFTLIELLVVISIIGILASFIIASFTSAQQKARDSRRKSDLDALKKALELAKSDSPASTVYPYCTVGNVCTLVDSTRTTPDLVARGYIKAMPTDPVGNYYIYVPLAVGCRTTNSCSGFVLIARLENANDPSADTAAPAFGTSATACNVGAAGLSPTQGQYYACNY